VCGTLPVQEGKLWLLRRGIEPRLGFWTYPAGYQEIDETSEEAAIRETYEEIGAQVQLMGLHGVYSRAHAPVVNIVYRALLVPESAVPRTSEEALEVALFSRLDIPWSELAFESTTKVLSDWVRWSN
jgi:ADP-ribose pyrophosphatase YjhB (NUDIX family)